MLSELLGKPAKFSDNVEDYFYHKMALINHCSIFGNRAVDCLLHGIDDTSVLMGTEAVQFDHPDKLLANLRNVKIQRPDGLIIRKVNNQKTG